MNQKVDPEWQNDLRELAGAGQMPLAGYLRLANDPAQRLVKSLRMAPRWPLELQRSGVVDMVADLGPFGRANVAIVLGSRPEGWNWRSMGIWLARQRGPLASFWITLDGPNVAADEPLGAFLGKHVWRVARTRLAAHGLLDEEA